MLTSIHGTVNVQTYQLVPQSRGWGMFSVKSQIGNTFNLEMGMVLCQENFIYKSRWWVQFGPQARLC